VGVGLLADRGLVAGLNQGDHDVERAVLARAQRDGDLEAPVVVRRRAMACDRGRALAVVEADRRERQCVG
jgi:hypothetical protein